MLTVTYSEALSFLHNKNVQECPPAHAANINTEHQTSTIITSIDGRGSVGLIKL